MGQQVQDTNHKRYSSKQGGPPSNPGPSRAGGLLRARPKEMTPVFTVLMTVLTVDFVCLLALPFALA